MQSQSDWYGMRHEDRSAFRSFCRHKHLWILVRTTNPHSVPYIGKPGYTSKPFAVKAKTANRNVPKPQGGDYELKGLVVDPTCHPRAFTDLASARKHWNDFQSSYLTSSKLGAKFRVEQDPGSPHYGCLIMRTDGSDYYVHGDYDLKDVIEPGREDWHLALESDLEGVEGHREVLLVDHDFEQLRAELNRWLGVPMVNHGTAASKMGHEEEPIVVLSPEGHDCVLKDRGAVEVFYQMVFKGRPVGGHRGVLHVHGSPDPALHEHARAHGGLRDFAAEHRRKMGLT
jgi:hypothetical protein